MLTALVCVFSLIACNTGNTTNNNNNNDNNQNNNNQNNNNQVEIGNPLEEVVAASSPTEVVTQVTYSYPSSEKLSEFNGKLNGFYMLRIDDSDSIFDYEYRTLATPEEMIPDGVKLVKGTLYCKDGKTSVDGDSWSVITADTVNAQFTLVKGYFKTYEKSEDEKTLTATITGENIANIIGHELSANGDINFVLKTNGIYLTGIEINYKSLSGADVFINTSYTYNDIELEFPAE